MDSVRFGKYFVIQSPKGQYDAAVTTAQQLVAKATGKGVPVRFFNELNFDAGHYEDLKQNEVVVVTGDRDTGRAGDAFSHLKSVAEHNRADYHNNHHYIQDEAHLPYHWVMLFDGTLPTFLTSVFQNWKIDLFGITTHFEVYQSFMKFVHRQDPTVIQAGTSVDNLKLD